MPGKKKTGGGGSKGGAMDFMTQLKSQIAVGGKHTENIFLCSFMKGGLKRVNLSEEDKKQFLGDNAGVRPGGASIRWIAEV
jgi:hypothetical protein